MLREAVALARSRSTGRAMNSRCMQRTGLATSCDEVCALHLRRNGRLLAVQSADRRSALPRSWACFREFSSDLSLRASARARSAQAALSYG